MDAASIELTQLLEQARDGEPASRDALLAAVYQQLRSTAARLVRGEAPGHTLSSTDVVHEAYLRLFGGDTDWENRRQFFSNAATAMRRILIEHARRKHAAKRQLLPVEPCPTPDVAIGEQIDLLALDHALDQLAAVNPRQAKIVELRYFAGITDNEIADLLQVSRMTVHRDWQVARMRLKRSLSA